MIRRFMSGIRESHVKNKRALAASLWDRPRLMVAGNRFMVIL